MFYHTWCIVCCAIENKSTVMVGSVCDTSSAQLYVRTIQGYTGAGVGNM